ncbi:predicted protein [Streptomyces lividans TK24]|uniref:Uncharacterized protein n=1 Tax=Streptomyces lividans 1326 TaxID=1200984 RepID=A0A7U9DWA7_STRLI|nr:predicted protein [Streptomyces lividans TK24]EOY51346.1 hypothetical protein SLI_6640 [Streptomyces lividans 1326]
MRARPAARAGPPTRARRTRSGRPERRSRRRGDSVVNATRYQAFFRLDEAVEGIGRTGE